MRPAARLLRRTGSPARSPVDAAALAPGPIGLLLGLVVAGPMGALVLASVGLVVGALLRRRLADPTVRARRARLTVDLPLAIELLAAAAAAGLTPVAAAAVVGAVVPGEVGQALRACGPREREGRDPWQAVAGLDHPLAPRLAEAARRSTSTGAAWQPWLAAVVLDERAQGPPRAHAAAQRAAAWSVLPLGLCFLPAYLLIAVVPSLLGLAHHFP